MKNHESFASATLFSAIIISLAAFLSVEASADLKCANINGEWSGQMRGLQNGKTTMTINNCKVSWQLPDGRTNRCRFKEKNGKTEYSCSLGSRGIVDISGRKIKMQNVYTAYKHGKYTVNISKTD